MAKRVKFQATKNTAKAVTKPKMKSIPIHPIARAEINKRSTQMDNYIAGIVASMGIKGPWNFDFNTKSILVPDIEKE